MEIEKKLGSGAMSEAYLLKNGRVLIVGKREDAFSSYTSLAEKMKCIDGNVSSLKISGEIEVISPNETYPYGAIIEDYVKGVTLKKKINQLSEEEKVNIGKSLAKFIYEMRNIPYPGDKQEEIGININKYEKSLRLIKDYVDDATFQMLEKTKQDYYNLMQKSNFHPTHGDLQEENIIINENNEVEGIIDFGNMEYYLTEVEFAPMFDYDSTIFNSMLENYNLQISTRQNKKSKIQQEIKVENIQLIKLVRQVRFFKHIVNLGDKKIKEELDKIKHLLDLQSLKI